MVAGKINWPTVALTTLALLAPVTRAEVREGACSLSAAEIELKNGAEYALRDVPESLTVRMKRGGSVRFLLEENATTGYQWVATYSSNECAVAIEHRGASAAKGLCGAPSKAAFTVTKNAAVQSPSLVEFAYRRSWEAGVKPAKVVRLVLYTIPGEAVDFRYPASRTLNMLKAECRNRGIELIDWHVHIRGGLTPEMAAERERASGIRQSAMENHGREWEIFDNERLVAFAEAARKVKVNGHTLPVGIQVNDRDWFRQIDAATRSKFDYILADTMIMGKLPNGRDRRLWLIKDLFEIGDPEKWMDEYVEMNLQILSEPISILANPGYLPAPLDGMREKLWTEARMRRVIAKAVELGIAIEIQAESPYPSPRFLKLAKAMGAKFSFGTNNYDAAPKDLSRWLEAIVWLDLHPSDIWTCDLKKNQVSEGRGLTDRFVADARTVYGTEAYAGYTNSLLSKMNYRRWTGRADVPSGGLVRWVDVGGTVNFRDIGGWNGLKSGMVYRGAEPNCHPRGKDKIYHDLSLTAEGARTLSDELHIRTDLDLRGPGESPTPDATPIPGAKLVRIPCANYTNFLRRTEVVAKLLRVFTDAANYPIYFHCWGGADRTGSLAFILEGLCGVNEVDLCIDYELTSFSQRFRRTRLDGSYFYASMVREMQRRPGATLSEKIENYVRDECGLSSEEIRAIRSHLRQDVRQAALDDKVDFFKLKRDTLKLVNRANATDAVNTPPPPKGPWTAFAPGEVAVGGEIGRRMEITAAHIIDDIDIDQVFLRHFRVRKEKPEAYDGFTGWGMLLDAIVKAAAHGIGGSRFRAFKDKWMAATIATQTEDGNISIFAGKLGIWDSHEQGYLMQAFCRDWEWFGNAAALEAARKLGDYMLKNHAALQAGMCPAFTYLYRMTSDRRYLDWLCQGAAIERDDAAYSDRVPLNGTAHVYGHIERAFHQLEYAAELGREFPTLEDSARCILSRVSGDYLSVTGTLGGLPNIGEYWDDSQIGLHPWGETCASAYLMRFLSRWQRRHPDPACGDLYERVMYNALFGAQSQDGKRYRYFSPFNQPGEWWSMDAYCCPNNFRRIMFEIPDSVFFKTGDGFAVNLFAPAELKTSGLTVKMTTDYPNEGKVSWQVKSERPGIMRVRIPLWSKLADAGTWREFRYDRGERSYQIDLPMAIRFVKGRRAQTGRVALLRGPIVYEVEKGGAYIDCWKFDVAQPVAFKDGRVEATMLDDHHQRPRHQVKLAPFSSENRKRVYFPTIGQGGPEPVDDELFGRWRK